MKAFKQTLIIGAGVMLMAIEVQAQSGAAGGMVASSSAIVQQTEELKEMVGQEKTSIYNGDYQNRRAAKKVSDRIDVAYEKLREKYRKSANKQTPRRKEFLPSDFVENKEKEEEKEDK